MVFYTGDIHGDITKVCEFLRARDQKGLDRPDVIVILGDVAFNYYLDGRDERLKREMDRWGVDILCIHGNHEARPQTVAGYVEESFRGGRVLVQPEYPHLKFAIDGEVYDLDGRQSIVIGGAYSVDKFYRLSRGFAWFGDEQPDDETKKTVERVLADRGWCIDQVLSHTCPYKYIPSDTFLPGIDQLTVDNSTERWLDHIEDLTGYSRWLCGHWHIDRDLGRFRFVMDDFVE